MVGKWSTKKDLISYVMDGMGSEGNGVDAEKMTDLILERGYVELEWNGYYLVRDFGDDFFDLWNEILAKVK